MSGTIDPWIATSGSWSAPGNWQNGLPLATSLATFNGTTGETVTFATTAAIDGLAGNDAAATLDMTSGALTVATGGNWSGRVVQAGGTLGLTAGTLTFSGTETQQAAATTEITGGATLSLTGGGTLDGLATGAGMLLLAGGAAYAIGGISALGAGTVEILDNGGTVALAAQPVVTGSFILGAGVLSVAAHALVLKGASSLSGTISGAGEVLAEALTSIGYLAVTGGGTLLATSTVLEAGNLQLGAGTADGATLRIASGATYEFAADAGVTAQGNADIVNAGVLEKSGAAGNSYIAADLTSTGQIIVNQGTIGLQGTADTISGAVSGAGTLNVLAGTVDLATASLDVAGFGIYGGGTTVNLNASPSYGGTFVLDGATLNVASGDTLTLRGGDYLRGLIDGPGSVSVTGSADLAYLTLSGSASLTDARLLTQDAPIYLGATTADTAHLTVDAGATFDLLDDVYIYASGTAGISSSGLFEKTGAGGTSVVFADMTSTFALEATTGNTLALEGATNTLSGLVVGYGEVDLRGGGQFTIAGGTGLDVLTLGILDSGTVVRMSGTTSYHGTFLLGGGTLEYAAAGSLALTGSADLGGTLLGPLAVSTTGVAQTGGLTLSGGAKLIDASRATQTGTATLGTGTADVAALQVDAGALYDLASDSNVNAAGTATISNAGVFEKTAAGGTSAVFAGMTNTGEVLAAGGNTLALEGATNLLGGSLEGAGEIDLRGGGRFTLESGVALGVATLGVYDAGTNVTLNASTSYAGQFNFGGGATLDLGSATLTLFNAALDGTVSGGIVLVRNLAETGGLVLTGGATLDDANVAVLDNSNLTIGTGTADTAELLIGAGHYYEVRTDNNIDASGTAMIDNAGVLAKTGFTGTSYVYADIDSTGTVAVYQGTLSLDGASNTLGGLVSGGGELDLGNGGTTTLAAGVTLSVDTLGIYGSGTQAMLAGSAVYMGRFTLGGGAGLVLSGNSLTLDGTGLLQGGAGGAGELVVATSADAQFLTLTGGATLAVTGTVTQDDYIVLGTGTTDTSAITVAAGATYDLISDDVISAKGTATISNAGTFEKTETDGTSTVAANVVNTGRISATIGTINFQGTLANDGTIAVTDAAVIVSGALTQGAGLHGAFDIGAAGTVAVAGSAGSSQSFAFTGASGTLRISDPAAFAGNITGFVSGNTIDLAGIAANGISYSGGVLTVTETVNNTLEATYHLNAAGIANSGSLELVYDNDGGTEIVLDHAGPDFTNASGSIISDYWTLDASGNWNSGAWYQVIPEPPPIYSETVDVPANAGNDAVFDPNGTNDFTITYNETDTVNNLTGDFYATLDVTGGKLTINQGGLWNAGFNNTGGTLDAVTGWSANGETSLGANATDEVDSGTFAIGSGTLAGTVDGQGTFLLETGDHYTIDPGFKITVGTFDLSVYNDGFSSFTTLDTDLGYAGTFILTDYSGNPADLFLNGYTLTLTGTTSYLNGYVSGKGELVLAGTAEVGQLTVNNSGTVTVTGSVEQDGLLTTGNSTITPDDTVLLVSKTGTWDIVNNTGINGYGNSSLDNTGLFKKTGGTGASIVGADTFTTTGKLAVNVGTLILNPLDANLGGSITGAGTLDLGLGQFTLDAGASVTTAALSLILIDDGFGIALTLDENFAYAGTFSTNEFSTLDVNHFTATLRGRSFLTGLVDGAGTLALAGPSDVNGLTINNSVVTNITGVVTQDGLLTTGSSGQTPDKTVLAIATNAIWDIVDDTGINGYGNSSIDNTGTFEKTGGTGASIVGADTFTTTGKLEVNTGTLILNPLAANLGGSISGAGALDLGLGQFTLDAGASVTTTSLSLILINDGFEISLTLDENFSYAGSFSTDEFSTLAMGGFNATFTGGSFWTGGVNGTGTLDLAGVATFDNVGVSGALVDLTKTANAVGNLSLAGGAALAIAAGGVFDLLVDGNAETGGAVSNAGLIEKTAGTGTSYIQGDLTNTGTITAATGTIDFQYAANSKIGGTVSGAGGVFFVSGGNYTIEAGTVLSVATLGLYGDFTFGASFSYAGTFDFGGGTLGLNGHTLTLSGFSQTLDGTISGTGTLSVAQGRTAATSGLTLAGTAVLNDAGTLIADGNLVFGASSADATSLVIAATGVLNLNSDGYSSFQGAPVLRNAGLIEKTGITATSSLDASVTNTGTILVNQGTLLIAAPGTSSIGGTVEGAGGLTLQGGSTTLAPGLALTIADFALADGATEVLNLSLSYAGAYTLNGATQVLHGDTLTLAGLADLAGGTITGPGLLETTGTASLGYVSVDGGATFDNAGVLAQSGNLTLGDAGGTGNAVNAAGDTWNVIADVGVTSSGSIAGTLDNLGLLEKTAGTGTSAISSAFADAATGTINVATGTIMLGSAGNVLAGVVKGAGSLVVQGFATISSLSVTGGSPDFAGGASVSGTIVDTGATLFTSGTLSGAGTLDLASHGVADLGGTVTSGITVAFKDATDTLRLANPAGFAGTITGLVAGDTIDLLNTSATSITGVNYAANTLTVDVAGGTSYALHLPGSFSPASFHIAADGHNGAAITV
jgi:hypothetical protein